jgi:hypothetical protein
VKHEINGGDDDSNPNQVGTSWGRSHKSRDSRGSMKEWIWQPQATPLLAVNVGLRLDERG